MPEKSVGFAIGNLRARENRLLKKNDLSGFAAANKVRPTVPTCLFFCTRTPRKCGNT